MPNRPLAPVELAQAAIYLIAIDDKSGIEAPAATLACGPIGPLALLACIAPYCDTNEHTCAGLREPLGGGRADPAQGQCRAAARPQGGRGTHNMTGRRPLTRTLREAPDLCHGATTATREPDVGA